MANNTKENTKEDKKSVGAIILDVLVVVFIVFAAIIIVMSLTGAEKGVSNIFGYSVFSIQSPSMEPVINTGDLIITEKCDVSTLEEGDIISFFAVEQEKLIVKTHRIEKVINKSGIISFITKGDNNPLSDDEHVVSGDVISKYTGIRIPAVGKVIDFLKSKVGFFVCIIIPLIILFLYNLYKFIVEAVKMQQEKNKKA